jgi:hypothetical protein
MVATWIGHIELDLQFPKLLQLPVLPALPFFLPGGGREYSLKWYKILEFVAKGIQRAYI